MNLADTSTTGVVSSDQWKQTTETGAGVGSWNPRQRDSTFDKEK